MRLYDTDHFSHSQVERMLDLYSHTLSDLGYEAAPYPEPESRVGGNILRGAKYDSLNHALWMCEEALKLVEHGRWAKAHRWIGMIQGLLFMTGIYSIADLKEHNRSPAA